MFFQMGSPVPRDSLSGIVLTGRTARDGIIPQRKQDLGGFETHGEEGPARVHLRQSMVDESMVNTRWLVEPPRCLPSRG